MNVNRHYDIYSHKLFYAINQFNERDEQIAEVHLSAYYPNLITNPDDSFSFIVDVYEKALKVASWTLTLRNHDVKGFFNFHDDLFKHLSKLSEDFTMKSAVYNFLMKSLIGRFDGSSELMEVK